MKKLKNLKARLLSLSLAFAMVLSLAMGMAPMNVQAEGDETVDVTFDISGLTGELMWSDGSDNLQDVTDRMQITIPKNGTVAVLCMDAIIKVTTSDASVVPEEVVSSNGASYCYINNIGVPVTIKVENATQGGENVVSSISITNHAFDEVFADIQDGTLNSTLYYYWPEMTVLDANNNAIEIPYKGVFLTHRTSSGWTLYCECSNLSSKEHAILLEFQTGFNLGADKQDITNLVNFNSNTLEISKAWVDYDCYSGNGAIYVVIAQKSTPTPTPPPAGETCEHTNIVNHKCTNCGYCTIKFNYDPSRVALVAGTSFTRSDSWLSIGADKHSEYGISAEGASGLQIRMVDYAILGEQNPNNEIMPEYTSEGATTGRAWNVLYALSDGGVISENNQYALYVNLYNGGNNRQGTNKFGETGDVFGPITTSTGAKVYGIVSNGGSNVKFAVPVTFKPPCEHSWSETWSSDENAHWKTCTKTECGAKDEAGHIDDNQNNKCDVCNWIINPNLCTVTIDSSRYDHENGYLYGWGWLGEDQQVFRTTQEEIVVEKGHDVVILSNIDFKIAVEGTYESVSDKLMNGDSATDCRYEISGVNGDIKITVNPPAPAPTPGNGGSSSSSSSSSTPSTTTPAPTPITVPVSNGDNDNVVNINASVSGEKASVSELTADEINKVAKNETEKSIEINLSDTGKKVKEAALPVSSLNEIARIMDEPNNKLDNITIKLSTATVEVSEHTLKAVLSKTTGNDLRLVVDDVHKDTLNNTQKEAVKNQNVHQCIDAYFISNGVRIGDFQGGTATIRLPFNVPAGLNGNGFSVWYVGDDGRIEKHDTRYVNGELVFTVSHFSDYVVVYDDAVKDDVPKTGEAADYSTMLWTSILAIGVLGLVLNRQKKRQ